MGGGGALQTKEELKASDYDVFAIVEGAGTPEINGRYRWVECGTYEQSTTYNGEKVKS